MYFSKNIKNYRISHNLTQEQLGGKLNVSRKTISSWENDRTQPDYETLKQLSEIFNVPLSNLIEENSIETGNLKTKIKHSREAKFYFLIIQFTLIIGSYLELFNIIDLKIVVVLLMVNTVIFKKIAHITETKILKEKLIFIFLTIINLFIGYGYNIFYQLMNESHSFMLGYSLGILIIIGSLIISEFILYLFLRNRL